VVWPRRGDRPGQARVPGTPDHPDDVHLSLPGERGAGSTLVQWKAIGPPRWCRRRRGAAPPASNHGSAIRSCRSDRVSRPCSGCLAKAAALSATHALVVDSGREDSVSEAGRELGARSGLPRRAGAPSDAVLARRSGPARSQRRPTRAGHHGPRGRWHRRPGPASTGLGRRRHAGGRGGRRVRGAGRIDLAVAGEFPVDLRGQVACCADAARRRSSRKASERGANPVVASRGLREGEHGCDVDVGHEAPTSDSSSSGTKRYPTLRTVPMSTS
jgi:hypothetical protein